MKRLSYLLIFLLISAQMDDAWAAAPIVPSAPLTDEEEYLPAQRQVREAQSSSDPRPIFVDLEHQTSDFLLGRGGAPSERNLTTPFTPPFLYVFMSLQI